MEMRQIRLVRATLLVPQRSIRPIGVECSSLRSLDRAAIVGLVRHRDVRANVRHDRARRVPVGQTHRGDDARLDAEHRGGGEQGGTQVWPGGHLVSSVFEKQAVRCSYDKT